MRSDSRFLVSGWYPFGGCFLPRRSHGCRLSISAARFVPPISAALVTAVAVAWSVPNYFASMPSYYNLFLATFGTRRCFVTSNAEAAAGWHWPAAAAACRFS